MKKQLFWTFTIAIALIACKKENRKEVLPPETQTGANTFGCLVDGEVFTPGGAQLSGGSLNCYYQKVNNKYQFNLVGKNYIDKKNRKSVALLIYGVKIKENAKYILFKEFKDSIGYGSYTYMSDIPFDIQEYETDSINQGELYIKYFDSVNQIVSGTFWFNAAHESGKIVRVSNGRFDMTYKNKITPPLTRASRSYFS